MVLLFTAAAAGGTGVPVLVHTTSGRNVLSCVLVYFGLNIVLVLLKRRPRGLPNFFVFVMILGWSILFSSVAPYADERYLVKNCFQSLTNGSKQPLQKNSAEELLGLVLAGGGLLLYQGMEQMNKGARL